LYESGKLRSRANASHLLQLLVFIAAGLIRIKAVCLRGLVVKNARDFDSEAVVSYLANG
jgi:hypothetical protein